MTINPHLCIGTAQFGLDYGVTNKKGLIEQKIVRKILKRAIAKGINILDTAQNYGSSEYVIGNNIPFNSHFKIITKLSPQNQDKWDKSTFNKWEDEIKKSMNLLKIDQLEGLLVHKASDLLRSDSKYLINWLFSLKERGLVNKLGLSIYNDDQIMKLPLDGFQLIQLPLSIYDQTLLQNGTLQFLKELGFTIYARSVFLQGLILQEADLWPSFLSKEFINHHHKVCKFTKNNNVSLLDLSLHFLINCNYLDAVVVGLTSVSELDSIQSSWEKSISQKLNLSQNFNQFAWKNPKDTDPRAWNKL